MTAPIQPQRRLVIDAVILGVAGALGAWLFTQLLRAASHLLLFGVAGYRAPGLPSEGDSPLEVIGPHGLWMVPLVTALGGLAVGLLTTWLAPEAEGHGTDAVVRSFHREGGRLRGRVAPVKLITSAITIGSGGSAGREGPIALVGAAFASWYGQWTRRSEEERRLLLLMGAAAGISAIFRSPIGAALFSVEVLYADMEFEAAGLLYATLAAIVAYALGGLSSGFGALFVAPTPLPPLGEKLDYAWYAVLGVAAGVMATALPMIFYKTRDAFRSLPLHDTLKPALGGLLTGFVALAIPEVIGGGYGWMQSVIDGRMTLGLLLTLAVAKMVAMSLTIGSGGSGGVFAPSLFVGGMLGGACAAIAHLPAASFVVVGMAAVFAGAAHVPFATMMMVTEMTGGYTLLVPAALAVLLSYLVQRQLAAKLRYRSVYEAAVGSRGESPAHHTQHLEIALRLLRERKLTDLDRLGHLDLVSLVQSGLAVDLGEGRRLMVGVLRSDSPMVGTTIGESGRDVAGPDTNVVAILRQEHMLAPRHDTVLQPSDRLIMVAGTQGMGMLERHLDPW